MNDSNYFFTQEEVDIQSGGKKQEDNSCKRASQLQIDENTAVKL